MKQAMDLISAIKEAKLRWGWSKDLESNHSRFEQHIRRHAGEERVDDSDAVADDALDGGRRDLVHDQVPVLVGELVGRVSCCQHRVADVNYVCNLYTHI